MEGLHDIKTNFGSTYIYIHIYTYTVYMEVCIYTLYISSYIHLTYGRHLQVRYLKCPVMKHGGYDGDGSIHLGKKCISCHSNISMCLGVYPLVNIQKAIDNGDL